MAKVGLYLHGARGKLAGSSLYRGEDGSTQMREIVTPHNPRTDQQIYQRAVWATIMQAYAAGRDIFDHSFQGVSAGADTQRLFTKLNVARLRQALSNDIKNGDTSAAQDGRFVPMGEKYPVPWYYQISQGELPQILSNMGQLTGLLRNETVAEYCMKVGITPGDIFTICLIQAKIPTSENVIFEVEGSQGDLGKYTQGVFAYARFEVKSNCLTNNDTLRYFVQLFDLTAAKNLNIRNFEERSVSNAYGPIFTADLPFQQERQFGSVYRATVGCIHSRKNEDLRSTSFMEQNKFPVPTDPDLQPTPTPPAILDGMRREYGTSSSLVLEAWRQDTIPIVAPETILEGGG